MKICTKCKVEKSLTEFHRWSGAPDGYKYNCKDCLRAYRKANSQLPQNIARNKAYHFKVKYGITIEEYDELLKEQGGVCAICKQPETQVGRSNKPLPLAVDHCHKTNRVRGLLCKNCNISLGNFSDNITTLKSAIKYLQQWEVIE